MRKISWTCQSCGIWHSVPDDDHLRPEFCTYDGKESARFAIAGLAEIIARRVPPDLLIRIESTAVTHKAAWLSSRQLAAKDLRRLTLSPLAGQPFPLFCACGFDSSSLLKAGIPEVHHVSVPMIHL